MQQFTKWLKREQSEGIIYVGRIADGSRLEIYQVTHGDRIEVRLTSRGGCEIDVVIRDGELEDSSKETLRFMRGYVKQFLSLPNRELRHTIAQALQLTEPRTGDMTWRERRDEFIEIMFYKPSPWDLFDVMGIMGIALMVFAINFDLIATGAFVFIASICLVLVDWVVRERAPYIMKMLFLFPLGTAGVLGGMMIH